LSFLGDLSDQLASQYDLNQNVTSNLDAIIDGQQGQYNFLGSISSQFDQSSERRYVEEGYLRTDPYSTDLKQYQILLQEPNATVLVKKRMFSSIAENYRPDFMDEDEKLYYKAMTILLQNKCIQIAALEKLSKIQQVVAAVGNINDQLVPVIIGLADQANNGYGNGSEAFAMGGTTPFTTQDGTSFIQTVDRLRVLFAYNQTNPYTTWITDPTSLFHSTLGTGTGVIEITNFTNINTTTTVDMKSPGRFSLSIADPYEAMLISDYDIEIALSDASNLFYNNDNFQLTPNDPSEIAQQPINNSTNFNTNNKTYNYARRKLRFNFSGKLIIQPMDVIHVYMNTKSRFDGRIMSGISQMFSGLGILQSAINTPMDPVNATDTLFNPGANVAIQAEKSMYVGPNFPNYLWALMRTQFVTEREGTHVFGGVVESAIDTWSAGKFTIEVSGSDNTYYFRQGKINYKPGADAFNGLIFDPLTPFKSNFDSVTTNNTPGTLELLDENKFLLSQTGSGSLVRFKQGALAGEKATQGNYIQDQTIDPATGRVTRVFHAPDGLVYKWKQGIGVFTQTGSINTINDPNLVGTPNIYQEPFAGLDVMNVLSLLITGTPYNYATYYKATSNLFGFSGDPQSKQSSAYSYINSLRTSLSKTNTLWGNFIPYKNLVMNEQAIAQAMQGQLSINVTNADLDSKLKKLNNLQQALTSLGALNALDSLPTAISQSASSQTIALQSQVSNLQTSITASISSLQSSTAQQYNQINTSPSADSNYLIDGQNNPSDSQSRKLLRRQTNYLTRRMSYDVRANQDKNLFIVDDYYDIDYDIAAFNKALANGIELYSTEYTDVASKITQVADLLNLEVFCDSQGHMRARSPQYNRMPSSIFYRMLYLKQTVGVQVFPQFLNDLFTDQFKTLRENIKILEDQIRLDCAILGNYPSLDVTGDSTAEAFLTGANVTQGMGGTFSFISSPTGVITDFNNLIMQANQDQTTGAVDQSLSAYSAIKSAGTSTKQLFSSSEKYVVLFQALTAQNQAQQGQNTNNATSTSIFQSSVVQQLITRIQTKSGQTIVAKDYLTSAGPNQALEVNTGQTIDVFKVTDELSTYMQSWQSAVKLFYHTIKNAAEYKSLDDDTTTSNSLLSPGIFNNSNIPEVYEHMIEDETFDDYGPGSGSRYVIRQAQIRNISIGENAPPYTTVEAHGTLPFFAENQGPPGLNSFPGGGNALVSAIAIDYDMWRNYGFKQPYTINIPFLQDPVSQLGPYAAMILSRDRHNVLRGTLTISGNEYMQPGEVIYLENRNMLFYVNSVNHNLAEGTGFTTTLELSYGHSIGEYIPTVMDTIGKLIYKNQEVANTVIHRQDSSSPEESLGVVQLSGQSPNSPITANGSEDNNSTSNYAASNQTVIQNILYTTAYIINANSTVGNNIMASIELRIYYDNSHSASSQLMSQANVVLQSLTGAAQGPQAPPNQNQPTPSNYIPSTAVSIVQVNMDDETERRSPSQKAMDAARNQMSNVSTNNGTPLPSSPSTTNNGTNSSAITPDNNTLRTALFGYVIDCWLVFTQVESSMANPTSSTNTSNGGGNATTATTAANSVTSVGGATSTTGSDVGSGLSVSSNSSGPGF